MSEQSTEREPVAMARSTSATVAVKLRVNGANHELHIEPRVSLLDALREFIGLTGTKKGCDHKSLKIEVRPPAHLSPIPRANRENL